MTSGVHTPQIAYTETTSGVYTPQTARPETTSGAYTPKYIAYNRITSSLHIPSATYTEIIPGVHTPQTAYTECTHTVRFLSFSLTFLFPCTLGNVSFLNRHVERRNLGSGWSPTKMPFLSLGKKEWYRRERREKRTTQ